MNKTQSEDKPRRYFESIDALGYYREQLYYVHQQMRRKQKKQQLGSSMQSNPVTAASAESFLNVLRLCWPDGYGGKPKLPIYLSGRQLHENEVFSQTILKAVSSFGVDAVRISWPYEMTVGSAVLVRFKEASDQDEPYPSAIAAPVPLEQHRMELLYELGAAICAFLRFWRNQISLSGEIRSL
jgi:hypothetical protein